MPNTSTVPHSRWRLSGRSSSAATLPGVGPLASVGGESNVTCGWATGAGAGATSCACCGCVLADGLRGVLATAQPEERDDRHGADDRDPQRHDRERLFASSAVPPGFIRPARVRA